MKHLIYNFRQHTNTSTSKISSTCRIFQQKPNMTFPNRDINLIKVTLNETLKQILEVTHIQSQINFKNLVRSDIVDELVQCKLLICHKFMFGCIYHSSVYEKLQATRTKVAPVNLIYGSHFSAEATYKVSQIMGNFVEFTRTFTRITHKPIPV